MIRALLAALLVLPATAGAFVLATTSTGKPIRWFSSPVRFALAQSGARTLPAQDRGLERPSVRRAMLAWEAVAGSTLRFEYAGTIPDESVPEPGDELTGVRFFATDVPPDLGDAIALTLLTFDDDTGEILGSDMLFNERDYRFSVSGDPARLDLETVALHEAGHLVGLDHTCGQAGEVSPSCYDPALQNDPARYRRIVSAVLYPLRRAGEVVRQLTDDDAQGLSTLYPASPAQPGPRPASLEPGAGAGRVALTVRGADFASGAEVRLFLDGSGDLAAEVGEVRADRIGASVDLTGATEGCYDLLVQNPTGKQGAIFQAFQVGGVACRKLTAARSGGCACEAAGTGGGALLALAAAMVLWRFAPRRMG